VRVHHLNCATLCTLARPLLDGLRPTRGMICHCLLVEAPDGLVLVDTGLGTADVASPRARVGRGFAALLRPRLDLAETALRQIERLGHRAEDVRHVLVTHLDADHAGGLSDFPKAKVHVMLQEHEAAMLRTTASERSRYREAHWAHWPDFELYRTRGGEWFGFESVESLRGLPPEILLIPLFGHTRGHAGVAVRSDAGWLLHAGDAYFHRHEIEGRRAPRLLRLVERLDDMDHAARVANQARLAALRASGQVKIFCSHDPVELSRFPETA
jgi:glyoxylase-like metal-dependent hydrolase (beta-lactamase superfamily II)